MPLSNPEVLSHLTEQDLNDIPNRPLYPTSYSSI